jgi:two-component system, LytTR family, sensor kinase
MLQFGGWLAVGALLVAVRAGVVPLEFMIGVKTVFVALGFLITLGLRRIYRHLLRQGSALPHVIVASIACSGIAAVAWTIPYNLFLAAAAPWYLGVPYPMESARQLLGGTVQHTFMLLAWSVLYFGIRYYQRLQEERELALRAEADAHHAELQALRYQLNPHFLFNTLNSVSTLVHRDADAAAQMIARLSGFLRRTLEGAGTPVGTLEEELEFVRQYLAIEQIRFGDRLAVEIRTDPEVLAAQVPGLILQPLVENAVHHAISLREEGGRILIEACRSDGGVLSLTVSDNGAGWRSHAAGPESGIGLANTRRRLSHMYGKNYRLEVRHAPDEGVSVTIELPLTFKERVTSSSAELI